MFFNSMKDLFLFLSKFTKIGDGSQGACYYNPVTNQVYKIYNQYFDNEDDYYLKYEKAEIMRFSSIRNNTFIWANDVIYVNEEIVGYISEYVEAKSLYTIDPLKVNLDSFIESIEKVKKDIKIISNEGVLLYDVMYNVLYGKDIYVIDHDDFSYANMDIATLYKENNRRFNYEIYLFLVDIYFNEFVSSHQILNELYLDQSEDVLIFLKLLKEGLSELVGYNISNLGEAKSYMNKRKRPMLYQRNIK